MCLRFLSGTLTVMSSYQDISTLKKRLGFSRKKVSSITASLISSLLVIATTAEPSLSLPRVVRLGPSVVRFDCRRVTPTAAVLNWTIVSPTDRISSYQFSFFARRGTPARVDTGLIRVGGELFAAGETDAIFFSRPGANVVRLRLGSPNNPSSFISFVNAGRLRFREPVDITCFIPEPEP